MTDKITSHTHSIVFHTRCHLLLPFLLLTVNSPIRGFHQQQMKGQRDFFYIGWNLGAITSVLLPLLTWSIACLVKAFGGDGDQNRNEETSSWWSWGNGRQEERGAEDQQWKGAILFVYLWSLISFGLIVWYGNAVFRRSAHPLPLLSALVVHCNACLMCLLLVCSLGVSHVVLMLISIHTNICGCCGTVGAIPVHLFWIFLTNHHVHLSQINYDERQLEERGWLSQFGACSTLTFASFMLYSIIFVIIIRHRSKVADSVPFHGTGAEVAVQRTGSTVSNDYQREPSSQQEEQREPNHLKSSWTFY